MQNMSGNTARPRRKPNVAVYSSKYYALKLKEGFDATWDRVKGTLPPSARVSKCQEYVQSCWEKESDEVKEEIAREADAQYEAAMTEYRALNSVPEASAEEYHRLVLACGLGRVS
jgi:hypothetical protein